MIQTSRGYDDPHVRQLAIFLPNKVGELSDALRHLEKAAIHVHAMSVADSVDFAVVRLVVDHVDRGTRVFESARIPVATSTVLAVELLDEAENGVLRVCRALLGAEINVHYAYPMLTRPRSKPVIILHVDEPEVGADILTSRGFYLLTEEDLESPDALEA